MRTWASPLNGSTTMLTGAYTTDGEISRRLLDALPRLSRDSAIELGHSTCRNGRGRDRRITINFWEAPWSKRHSAL